MKINLDLIDTEQINANTKNIDSLTTFDVVKLINQEDNQVITSIKNNIEQISQIIDDIFITFKDNGRLFYMGAGSSGRIGVLDASEMLPTYGLSDKIIGLIAGGDLALRHPVESIEDDVTAGINELKNFNLTKDDSVIVIGASGRTPYCIGALKFCQKIGARHFALCMTKNSEFKKYAQSTIELETGAEVIAGSTRMKAGSATKMVLNIISTTLMIKLGKVYKNLMVDVKITNYKLEKRAINIIKKITNENDDAIIFQILKESKFNVKVAIVVILKKVNVKKAIELLKENQNILAKVIG